MGVARIGGAVNTVNVEDSYRELGLSPDDRVLYLAHNTEQGDIWLLTLK